MASFFSSAGSFLITVLASVFVFGIVIFIHELGHFLTAKFSGIQVNEFALGMGPTLFSFTRGGTKYGLRLFPIGGFVSMEGEDEESEEAGSFNKGPGGKPNPCHRGGRCDEPPSGFCGPCLRGVFAAAHQHAHRSGILRGLVPHSRLRPAGGRHHRCGKTDGAALSQMISSMSSARTQQGQADLTVLRDGKRVQLDNVVFDTSRRKRRQPACH